MSEIKTINGKVEFLAIPAFDHEISGRKCHRLKLSESESDDVTELRKNNEWFYLTTATEEQASLLVWKMDGVGFFRYVSDDQIQPASLNWQFGLKTAKESLFSLLKANGCYTKEMRGSFIRAKARAGRPTDILDKTEYPDDYLLIIK